VFVGAIVPCMTNTFLIPLDRMDELQARIDKINKRAVKLDMPLVTLRHTGKVETRKVPLGGRMGYRMGPEYTYDAEWVEVLGSTPKIDGWEFVAVQVHRPAGNEYHWYSDASDVSEYRFRERECDHCHKRRVRNATYLVRHDSGPMMQVGSTCLGDFTGAHSPQAAAKWMENIYTLFLDLRGGWGATAGRTTRKFFLAEWLAFVSLEIREHGWMPGWKAYEEGVSSTAQRAKQNILAASDPDHARMPSDLDYAKADEAIEWVRDHGHSMDAGDFKDNLLAATVSQDATVVEQTMGLTAALFPCMWKWERDQAKSESQYVGAIKDKVTLKVTCERIGGGDFGYGWTSIYNMRDEQGNALTWFSSKHNLMQQGQSYTVTGTVKAHKVDSYTNEKTTHVTRCKVA
jgi:hypothetical protein